MLILLCVSQLAAFTHSVSKPQNAILNAGALARKLAFLVIAVGVFSGANAYGKTRNPDWVNLSGYYSQYTNAGGNTAALPHPAPSADVELGVRVMPILSLVGSLSNSVEPDKNDLETSQYRIRTYGGGLKLDLPGFFLLGAEKKDFKSWAKTSPINSFLIAEALSVEFRDVVTEIRTNSVAGRYGIGVDLFPFTTLSHFTLRVLYMNYQNSSYVVYSFGGGITF
jgi:hypothetical protein